MEPARPTDLARLEEGLRLLNRADPFVEVTTQDSGEHVIGAAGTLLSGPSARPRFSILSAPSSLGSMGSDATLTIVVHLHTRGALLWHFCRVIIVKGKCHSITFLHKRF